MVAQQKMKEEEVPFFHFFVFVFDEVLDVYFDSNRFEIVSMV